MGSCTQRGTIEREGEGGNPVHRREGETTTEEAPAHKEGRGWGGGGGVLYTEERGGTTH